MKGENMFNKLHKLSLDRPLLFSLLSTLLLLAAAMGISSAWHYGAGGSSTHILLVFIIFLIPLSYCTSGYPYGIGYSFFAVLWMRFLYSYSLGTCLLTFAGMAAITVFTSSFTSHLSIRSALTVENEKQSARSEMENMRANLLRAISHDLRAPLAGILGNTLVYLENPKTLDEAEKLNIVTSIHRDSSWLIHLVENLLAVTRIQNDAMMINTNEELVEEVISESLQKMENRHPECVIHAKIPDDFILIPMDAMLIEQVIINLLENAILHSGSAAPVDILVENEADHVSFIIRDYGNGIPVEMLNKLFQGVAYSIPHTADARKGLGIGLAICKTIISAHHGSIWGRNHEHGAEFIFTLPKGNQEESL